MEIQEFISRLKEEFDELEPGSLSENSSFRDLREWSSMHVLILIAMVDLEYDVTLTGQELRTCETIGDLHELVNSRI